VPGFLETEVRPVGRCGPPADRGIGVREVQPCIRATRCDDPLLPPPPLPPPLLAPLAGSLALLTAVVVMDLALARLVERIDINIGLECPQFVGVGGIRLEDGPTEYNLEDALVKEPLVQNAQQGIVPADSGKIGCTTFTQVVPVSTVADTASRSSVGRCATSPIEPIQFLARSARLGAALLPRASERRRKDIVVVAAYLEATGQLFH